MYLQDRLAQIQNGLKTTVGQKDGSKKFLKGMADLKDSLKSLEEVGTDLELVFREYLAELLAAKTAEKSLGEAGVLEFLYFAIDYAVLETQQKEKPVVIAGKLPYLVLEDALDGSPLSDCKEVWALMEAQTAQLTTAQLFQRGKLILLRICNSLLRRLSKASETEFCGRVLLYLAAAYPLSERSAVNVTGKANTGNITNFEEEEEFNRAMTAAQADSIQEEQKDKETMTSSDDAMDTTEEGEKKSSKSGTVVDYPFYRAFWGIQAFFCDPSKGGQSKKFLDELASNMESILTAFEGNTFSSDDLATARERFEVHTGKTPKKKRRKSSMAPSSAPPAAVGNQGLLAAPGKYLTDSKLMRLQLTDPQLRLTYITQFLLISQFLAMMKGLAAGLRPEVTLKPLEKRARALLEKTPPNGKEYLQILEHILRREVSWMEWKANGCKPYEKYPNDQLASQISLKAPNGKLKRRKRPVSVLKPATLNENKKLWTLSQEKVSEGLMLQAVKMSENKPDLNDFLLPFEEAMDPDAGIEDEYHPKHDVVFCWRGLRLLTEEHLSFFSDMPDGDLTKGVVRLAQSQKRPVPGEKKVEEEKKDEVPIKEEEEENKDQEKEEEKAGNPQSEAEGNSDIKKEEMANENDKPADMETEEETTAEGKEESKEDNTEKTNGDAEVENKETSEEESSKQEATAADEEESKEEDSEKAPKGKKKTPVKRVTRVTRQTPASKTKAAAKANKKGDQMEVEATEDEEKQAENGN